MSKPVAYNYKVAEDRIAELEEKVRHQAQRVNELLKENTDLKVEVDRIHALEDIVNGQHRTIETYHKIFMIQEAELKKYREGKHNETN